MFLVNKVKNSLLALMEKISPLESVIEYYFDNVFGAYIDKKISIEDLRKGLSNLEDIQLQCGSINQKLLQGLPFSLQEGRIQQLRIEMPSIFKLTTCPIKVRISGLRTSITSKSGIRPA